MKNYNVAVYGTGSMGTGIISLILEKSSLNLVGVISKRKRGRELMLEKFWMGENRSIDRQFFR